MPQGRRVADSRGRLAGGDTNEVMQRIQAKRSNIKPTGMGVGSAGGKSVVENERQATTERARARQQAWEQGRPQQ